MQWWYFIQTTKTFSPVSMSPCGVPQVRPKTGDRWLWSTMRICWTLASVMWMWRTEKEWDPLSLHPGLVSPDLSGCPRQAGHWHPREADQGQCPGQLHGLSSDCHLTEKIRRQIGEAQKIANETPERLINRRNQPQGGEGREKTITAELLEFQNQNCVKNIARSVFQIEIQRTKTRSRHSTQLFIWR